MQAELSKLKSTSLEEVNKITVLNGEIETEIASSTSNVHECTMKTSSINSEHNRIPVVTGLPSGTASEVGKCSSKADNVDDKSQELMSPKDGYLVDEIKSMIHLAEKEQWIQLIELSLVSAKDSDVSIAVAQCFQLLGNLHLSGFRKEMLEEAERLCKVATTKAQVSPQEAHDLFLVVAFFVNFMVSRKDPSLKYTSNALAKRFLTHSVNSSMKESLPLRWIQLADAPEIRSLADEHKESTSPILKESDTVIERWEECKRNCRPRVEGDKKNSGEEQSPSPSIDKLMKMIGLNSVKDQFLCEFQRISLAKEQGVSAGASSYNTRFDGNPGTGKTTVVKLYAHFLVEVGILPESSIIKETTGSRLISDGLSGLKGMLEELKGVGGGVIFVDEAYQLNPQQDSGGRQVLNFLLVHAERLSGEYGDIVWIFAGYKKDMDKLFEHNPGLPSRFPTYLQFDDYTDKELYMILESMLKCGGQEQFIEKSSSKAPKNKAKPVWSNTAYRSPGLNKPDETDRWGNIWKWNSQLCTYEDAFNNITGYGVTNLGDVSNPLMSRRDNTSWLFDKTTNLWYDYGEPSRTQKGYPGKPLKVEPQPVPPFVVSDPKWSRIAIRRLGKIRGTIGFGNARAVRILFDKARKRQAIRISAARRIHGNPDIFLLERDDLLGPRADVNAVERCSAWQELQAMEGLQEVKTSVKQLINLVIQNAEREDEEKPLLEVSLNRIFLGNPGTGKTSVAKLYARILADLGLLSKGEIILKNSSDFIGSALGTSEANTRAILAQSEGSVLVIDEAYGLNPSGSSGGNMTGTQDPYKTAVIDTLVEQVQGVPGEDRAVLLLGYRKQMEDLMAAANPGLSRRFQIENAFVFADYDDTALVRIMMSRSQKDGLQIDVNTAIFAVKQLAKAKAKPNFGNAGAVNNLLSLAKLNLQTRLSMLHSSKRVDAFIKDDFCVGGKLPEDGREEDIFHDLVGCDEIILKLHEYKDTISLALSQGKDPKDFVEFNFLFVGSPGTGKTTVARKMGKLFHSLGLLPTDEVVEVIASDLTTGYVGQASKATKEVLLKAKGKVLFLDEAYQLNPAKGGGYMQEVVDTMVQAITSKELIKQVVIILAGYEKDIDDMLQVNQGLKSRFSEKIVFRDFSVQKISEMLTAELIGRCNNNQPLSRRVMEIIPDVSNRLLCSHSFGNGRDIKSLSDRVFRECASRVRRETTTLSSSFTAGSRHQVAPEDVLSALNSLIESKKPPSTVNAYVTALPVSNSFATQSAPLLPPPVTQIISSVTLEETLETTAPEVMSSVDSVEFEAPTVGTFEKTLQMLLDARGLNNEQGVARISTMELECAELQSLIGEIATRLKISCEEAEELVRGWQSSQANVREKLKEQEMEIDKAKQQKRKALVPIWRCAVCGCSDLPYIVCFVSPYIVRYAEVDV